MKQIANHGQTIRYHHEMVGCNSRLDSIQAAVLRIKLRFLDAYCDARRKAAELL
jgi:UDP-2-acetamido-2-deoxy-ribo-hexuluronate aminotransferase